MEDGTCDGIADPWWIIFIVHRTGIGVTKCAYEDVPSKVYQRRKSHPKCEWHHPSDWIQRRRELGAGIRCSASWLQMHHGQQTHTPVVMSFLSPKTQDKLSLDWLSVRNFATAIRNATHTAFGSNPGHQGGLSVGNDISNETRRLRKGSVRSRKWGR